MIWNMVFIVSTVKKLTLPYSFTFLDKKKMVNQASRISENLWTIYKLRYAIGKNTLPFIEKFYLNLLYIINDRVTSNKNFHQVLAMEYNEFAKGAATITEIDFARILLRYTFLHAEEYELILERQVSVSLSVQATFQTH